MVGMEVRADDAPDRPPGEQARQQPLPDRPRRRVAIAGVEQRPAVAVVAEQEVDVVERERQPHPQPEQAVVERHRLVELRGDQGQIHSAAPPKAVATRSRPDCDKTRHGNKQWLL